MEAIVVTHEHSDHAGWAPAIAKDFGIPIIGSPGTLDAMVLDGAERCDLKPGRRMDVAGFELELFPVEHDTAEATGVLLRRGKGVLGYLTDTGHATPAIERALADCTDLVVESNHDPDMLRNGTYSRPLQRRITGGRGHLSNDACGRLLQKVVSERTRRIVLHHLSRNNNTPELALATNHALLHQAGRRAPELLAAPPRGPVGPFAF